MEDEDDYDTNQNPGLVGSRLFIERQASKVIN